MKSPIHSLALFVVLASGFINISHGQLVVFGDSFSDTAAVATDTRPMWADVVSQGLGFGDADPWTSAGDTDTNFADAGARADNIPNGTDGGIRDVPEQIQDFLGENGGSALSGALYLTFQGGNDLVNGADPNTTADIVRDNLQTLITAGAQEFAVANMIDGSLAPGNFFSTATATDFNTRLETNLVDLETANAGVTIHRIDLYSLVNDMVANPGDYGFTNVTDDWGASPQTDPVTDYLWYDNIHVTSTAHGHAGTAALSAIPEPSVVWLLLAGAGFLSARRSYGKSTPLE